MRDRRTDHELMDALRQGDTGALESLMQRHSDGLYTYAIRLGSQVANAQDLVQETWFNAWQKAASYKAEKAAPKTWLYRILHNKFIDSTRAHRRLISFDWLRSSNVSQGNTVTSSIPGDTIESATIGGDTTMAQLENGRQKSLLETALQDLPVNQRAALLMRHSQGMSNPDIAQVLGCSVSAVESQIARGKRALKSKLS